jgi:hypothetical protein
MMPYQVQMAMATERHNTLLSEAKAYRLGKLAKLPRQHNGHSGARRSGLRRFAGTRSTVSVVE